MAKPIETWAHAERDRQRALEAKMEKAMEVRPSWIVRDDASILAQKEAAMNAYMQREALAREQDMYGMGGAKVLQDRYISYDGSSTMLTATTSAAVTLSSAEGEALEKRIHDLEAALAERDEIIDALVAEIADADALREENARLRIVNALKSKPTTADGWIINTSADGEKLSHIPNDARIDIKWSGGDEVYNQPATCWCWGAPEPGDGSTRLIAAYRIIK